MLPSSKLLAYWCWPSWPHEWADGEADSATSHVTGPVKCLKFVFCPVNFCISYTSYVLPCPPPSTSFAFFTMLPIEPQQCMYHILAFSEIEQGGAPNPRFESDDPSSAQSLMSLSPPGCLTLGGLWRRSCG